MNRWMGARLPPYPWGVVMTTQRNVIKQSEPDWRVADGFGLSHWRKQRGEFQRNHHGQLGERKLKVG